MILCQVLFYFLMQYKSYVPVSFAVFSKFALLTLANFWKGIVLFNNIELAQCRLMGFTQIVTDVTSVVPTFLCCIALFWFVSFAFRFIILLCLLECAWGVSLLRERRGRCPRPCKPLKRLDRNFKCFCAVTFVSLIEFCAKLAPRLLSLGSHFLGRAPKKIKTKSSHNLTFLKQK